MSRQAGMDLTCVVPVSVMYKPKMPPKRVKRDLRWCDSMAATPRSSQASSLYVVLHPCHSASVSRGYSAGWTDRW